MEYRKFYLELNQQSPKGSTHKGTKDGGIVWIGETFPDGIKSVLMTDVEIAEFNTPEISDSDRLKSIEDKLDKLLLKIK